MDGTALEPAEIDFANPNASLGGRLDPPHDTKPASTPDGDDWGFRQEKRGMSTETKIGLALVLLLLGTFGFVVWKKLQQRDPVVASRYDEHVDEIDKQKPAPRRKAPEDNTVAAAEDHHPREYGPDPGVKPIPTAADEHRHGEFDFDRDPPKPQRTNYRSDDAKPIPDEFAFDDEFAPPREPRRQTPPPQHEPKDEFVEYEFAEDLFPREDGHRHHGQKPADEPQRLEIVEIDEFGGFDDREIRTTAAEQPGFDEFAFDDDRRTQRAPQRNNTRQSADGWDEFEPIPKRGSTPKPADDCPLPNDGWDDAREFEVIDATPRTAQREPARRVSQSRQLPADDCPIDIGPFIDDRPVDHPPTGQYQSPTADYCPPTQQPIGPPMTDGYPNGTRIHTVGVGDTYWTISRAMYGSARYFNALAKYNESRISDPKKMRPGMKVVVPPVEALHTRYPTLCGAVPDGAQTAQAPAGFFVGRNGEPLYRVGEEDTLSGIAHAHLGRASRWVQIYELNRERLPRPDTVRPGTVLVLPADASSVRLVQSTRAYR